MKAISKRTHKKLTTAYRNKGLSLGGAMKRLGQFKSKHSLY
jgi:hypothetical protein